VGPAPFPVPDPFPAPLPRFSLTGALLKELKDKFEGTSRLVPGANHAAKRRLLEDPGIARVIDAIFDGAQAERVGGSMADSPMKDLSPWPPSLAVYDFLSCKDDLVDLLNKWENALVDQFGTLLYKLATKILEGMSMLGEGAAKEEARRRVADQLTRGRELITQWKVLFAGLRENLILRARK